MEKIKSLLIIFVLYSLLLFVITNEDNGLLSTKRLTDLNEEIINLSDYDYPVPEPEESEYYSIALLGTSDIHGAAFVSKQYHPGINEDYSVGGLEILATHIKLMKKEWGDKLLWLDSGDQFQGGYETRKTEGKIITDFLNTVGLTGSTIGNHEFDFGQDFLGNRLNAGNFDYIVSNLEFEVAQKEKFKKLVDSKIYKVGNINVGVLALLTLETPKTTAGDMSGIKFLEYVEQIIKYSKVLQENKADIVLLVSHIGSICRNSDLDINKLRFYQETVEKDCDLADQEMNKILNDLNAQEEKDKTIYVHAVLGGHTHVNTHHFIHKKPVIGPKNNGLNYNIMYLKFKKQSQQSQFKFLESNSNEIKYVYEKEKSVIEGPIHVCERVFKNSKKCFGLDDYDKKVGPLLKTKFHNVLIEKDKELSTIFDKIYEELKPDYRYLTRSIVRLEGSRFSQAKGDYQLANIYTDCLRTNSNADFSIANSGGFRTSWSPGNITYVDLHNMFPFDTNVIKFKISGKDLIRLMSVVQEGERGPYPISGFQVVLKNKKHIETRLREGVYIDENRMYTMVGNEFLIKGGDDFSLVKDWFKPIDKEIVGVDKKILEKCFSNYTRIDKNTNMSVKRIILAE